MLAGGRRPALNRVVFPDAVPHPSVIPDYELLRLIGRGAYGEVWLARGVTGVFRAVKIVWRSRFPEAAPYEREFHGLKQFAEISLSEPRQLALLHVGRDAVAGYFYYVMELADDVTTGREIDPADYTPHTLKEVRGRRGRLPAGECIALGVELARALAGLHARGLVHRDIKPSNVIFVGGAPKLADIGLVTAASAALTFVGTEGFVPPEGPGAPGADVFALGKLLYELLTGLDRHDYPRLPADLHAWPDRKDALELNEVLIRACEPHPSQRHHDATALLDDLLLLQAGRSVRRLRKAERRLARALRIAALLALVAGVAGTGAYVERRRANDEMALRAQAEAERDDLARHVVYSATLSQAQRALEQDEYGRARKFLDEVVPKPGERDLREFEWYALRHEADGDPATILLKTDSPGQRVAFSPDGQLMAAQLADQHAVLWARDTRRELLCVSGVQVLAGISGDNRWLLGIDGKNVLRRWAVADGQPEAASSQDQDWPLGRMGGDQWLTLVVARGVRPIQLRAWDFSTHRELWRGALPHTGGSTEADPGTYLSAAVAPDGRSCAIGLIHGRALDVKWRIMVLALPEMTVRWEQVFDHRPTALGFGPTGEELLCGWGDTGEVGRLDLSDGKWHWQTKLPVTQFRVLAAAGAGRLAVGGRSSRLTFLDFDTGQTSLTRRGQESDIASLALSPVSPELLSTGNGGDVRLWSLHELAPPTRFDGFWSPAGGGRTLCVSANGAFIAATAGPYLTRLVQTDSGRTVAEIPDVILPVAFTPDAKALWLLFADGCLARRNLNQPDANIQPIKLPIKPFLASASPDCRWIVCADKEANLVVVDTEQSQVSAVVKTRHVYPWWIAVAPDGGSVATGGLDTMARLWEMPTGRLITEWKPTGDTVNAAFSPDSARLALVQSSGTLAVRDLSSAKDVASVVTSSGILQAVVFDPRAPRLFLGGRDGTMHVMDTRSWREITQLKISPGSPVGTVTRNAMSTDGCTLAGYTELGVIRLWRKIHSP